MPYTSTKQKLALVITELDVGGAEKCLVNLATGMDSNRFEPRVIVLGPPPSPPHDALVAQLDESHVPVQFLGFSSKWQLFAAARKLSKAFKQAAPRLIQSMLFHANLLTRMALPHGNAPVWCAGIRVADPSRMRQRLAGHAISRADRIVCVSQLVADYVNRRMNAPAEKLVVIANGVDTSAAASRQPADMAALGVPHCRCVIVCVARLEKQKGIDQLIRIAPDFLQELPDHDLVLVGAGSQEGELRRLARQTSVAQRIHFCGWRPNIGEILMASDLLVLPSRWEGMPNALLEAMARSRPVVCTRVEGVLEVLGPLAAQQTASPHEPQVFSEKVVTILKNPVLAAELGQANRRRVAECFSRVAMVRQYEKLYSQLLEHR